MSEKTPEKPTSGSKKKFQYSLGSLLVVGLLAGYLGSSFVSTQKKVELKAKIRRLERKSWRLKKELNSVKDQLKNLKQKTGQLSK